MRLTQEQDATMNAIASNVEMLVEGKDLVIGGLLMKADMQRIARVVLQDVHALWEEIGVSSTPTLGYAPCPWNPKHSVGLVTVQNKTCVHCFHTNCPMNRSDMTPEEWNRRE